MCIYTQLLLRQERIGCNLEYSFYIPPSDRIASSAQSRSVALELSGSLGELRAPVPPMRVESNVYIRQIPQCCEVFTTNLLAFDVQTLAPMETESPVEQPEAYLLAYRTSARWVQAYLASTILPSSFE